jgi:transcriptional regulator with XRE-family HTH domain
MDAATLLRVARARSLAASGEARRLRKAAGLSLQEIAGGVGCSAVAVWRWENGERAPRGEAAARYAALLDQLAKLPARSA